jgi:hypothetical protein
MDGKVRRRGLIAGTAALVAGLVATRTAERVGATTGGTTGQFLVIGANYGTGNTPNTSSAETALSGTLPADTMFYGLNFGGPIGNAASSGLLGQADNGWGVGGLSQNTVAVGGVSSGGGLGVLGRSASSSGVQGQTTTGTGVAGFHNATSGAGQGLYGQSNSPPDMASSVGIRRTAVSASSATSAARPPAPSPSPVPPPPPTAVSPPTSPATSS